ncbi:CoA transferase [Rhodococcus sp. G-MC3]|uniref:CaiB/BaiF CoA transferase family protein n=1 Tax=Rhodococcus sp. G-MC3 TaxID=3046209 RepID=UPI0024BA62D0|nr:CoA transferase [Rhodococcus sp. G-MC3]MDJ0394881.1 CoA transferase [Rhodococcus sp. G-MC3]
MTVPTKSDALNIGNDPTGPLSGVVVVDISTVVMGPLASQILGDFGADVIRIEPPFDTARHSPANTGRNEGMAPLYMQVNRNKRSVALNLKNADDLADLFELLKGADVLLTNMRLRALDRLGLGYEHIRERLPHLIYAHAQGFNAESSQSSRPAYDEVIQAVTGLVNLQERANGSLQFMPTFIADKTAALYLVNGVLAALFHRERTGEAQRVALAMADAMIAVNSVEHLAGDVFVPAAGAVGNPLSLTDAHAAMRTKDGGAIAATPYSYEAVRLLLIGAGQHERAADPVWDEPHLNGDVLYKGIREVLEHSTVKTTAEWVEYLTVHDMPFGVVLDIADLSDDPYVKELGLITEVDHPTEGRIRVVANPVNFSKTPVDIHRHAERAGQSTDEVLGSLRRLASVPSTLTTEGQGA